MIPREVRITTGGLIHSNDRSAFKLAVKAAEDWLTTLRPAAYRELWELLEAMWFFDERAVPAGIVKDWIEENGGERLWWAWLIPTVPDPDNNPNAPAKGKRRKARAA